MQTNKESKAYFLFITGHSFLFFSTDYIDVPCMDTLSCVCKEWNEYFSSVGFSYYYKFVRRCVRDDRDLSIIQKWEYGGRDDMAIIKKMARDFYYKKISRKIFKRLSDEDKLIYWDDFGFPHLNYDSIGRVKQLMSKDFQRAYHMEALDYHDKPPTGDPTETIPRLVQEVAREFNGTDEAELMNIIGAFRQSYPDVGDDTVICCFRYFLVGWCRDNDPDDSYFGICAICKKDISALPLYRTPNELLCCPSCCVDKWKITKKYIDCAAKKRKYWKMMLEQLDNALDCTEFSLDSELCTYPKRQKLLDAIRD